MKKQQKDENEVIQNFPIYNRGQLIVVNFGTENKYEFKGEHFAVVYTKKDSERSFNITVIPLTSKCKPYHVSLGKFLIEKVSPQLDNALKEIERKEKELKSETDALFKKQQTIIKEMGIWLDERGVPRNIPNTILFNLKRLIDFFKRDSIIRNSIFSKYDGEVKNIVERTFFFVHSKRKEETDNEREEANKKLISIVRDTINLHQRNEKLDKELEEHKNNLMLFKKTSENYEKKNKESFARINTIMTISKTRILKPINKYDPIKKVKLSEELMDKIDNGIREHFLKEY